MGRGVEVHMCSFTSKQHLKVLQKQREKKCVITSSLLNFGKCDLPPIFYTIAIDSKICGYEHC